jgi:hypothetical protein
VSVYNFSHFPDSFSASLLGKTVVVLQGTPRTIRVEFKAPCAGTFHAFLRITFSDKTRPNDQEWVVTRELHGCASLPVSDESASKGEIPDITEVIGDDDDNGITVIPYFALEFSAEYRRSDESFTTHTKDLIITKTSANLLVSFTAATVYSPDASMTE